MTTHHGNDGSIKIGSNTVAEVRSFEIEIQQASVEDDVMNDTWETHLRGKKRWTASAELLWDETDTNGQVAIETAQFNSTEVALSLGPEGHTTGDTVYTGNATIENMGIAAAHDGVVTRRVSFKGQGALTKTTVA